MFTKFKSALTAAILVAASSAFAQDGCRQVQTSCTQMKARCDQNCQSARNPSACMGAVCDATLNNCKQTGIWKASGTIACWKTNNKN
jgi:hypothetical protein